MPTPDIVNRDRQWLASVSSILRRDFHLRASQHTEAFNKMFLPNADYIDIHLRAKNHEYSLFSEQEYYRYVRLMTHKIVEMIACLELTGCGEQVLATMHLVDEIKTEGHFETVKGYVNALMTIASRLQTAA